MTLPRIVVLVTAMLGLAAAKAHAGATVSSNLQVESRAGQVLVHVEIQNRGTATIYVPRALAADPQPLGKTFVLTLDEGGAVDYTGRMVKRGPIGPADFVAVQPNSTLRHTLDITASYAFLPGQRGYTLQYAGGAVSSLAQLDRTQALEPKPARFTHTGTAP